MASPFCRMYLFGMEYKCLCLCCSNTLPGIQSVEQAEVQDPAAPVKLSLLCVVTHQEQKNERLKWSKMLCFMVGILWMFVYFFFAFMYMDDSKHHVCAHRAEERIH